MTQIENTGTSMLEQLQVCYSINTKDDDDPRNVNIPKTKGHRVAEGPSKELSFIGRPTKIKKVNIGTAEVPKLANIGDYWDDATMTKINELLHEYQDLFPTKFTVMKGIKGTLGEMKIPLNKDA